MNVTLRLFRNALLLVFLVIAGVGGYFYAYPQLRAAWLWRQAQEAITRGDLRSARESLRSCVAIRTDSGQTHFLLARTSRRAGDLDEARAELKEAARLEWPDEQ